jgi:thiopurine S-methyltransferase
MTPFVSLILLAQWEDRNLGWHDDRLHEAFVRFGDRIIPGWNSGGDALVQPQSTEDESVCAAAAPSSPVGRPGAVRVFFPLCGKSVDMAVLANHPSVSQVVGVDGIRAALDEFSAEHPDLAIHDETPAQQPHQQPDENPSPVKHDRLVGNKVLLLKGDFFDLDENSTDGRFEAVFDRGSLVAIEPSLRRSYVNVMKGLVQPGGKILLVAIERTSGSEEDLTAGPPFTLPEAQVRSLYEGHDWVHSVTLLESDRENERNAGRDMRSLFFLIETKLIDWNR